MATCKTQNTSRTQNTCKTQRCNRGETFGATYSMLGVESAPPGWNRVKGSENLGATAVAPVAPAVTSLRLKILLRLL